MNKTHWQLMTWREVADARDRHATVLLPAGTVETQGPYTYVGFEYIVPECLAAAVASQTNVIVTPSIPFGYSPDFQDYAGTISLRPEVLSDLYEDVVRSIIRVGFDHILLLASHIPNQPMIEQVAYKMRSEFHLRIAWMNPGQLAIWALKQVDTDFATTQGHGAEPGISLGEFMEPGSTDLTSLSQNETISNFGSFEWSRNGLVFDGFPVSLPLMLQDHSPVSSGVGDPRNGTPDRGRQIFERMVEYTVALVRAFEGVPTRVEET